MNKKQLESQLSLNGFIKDERGYYIKEFDGVPIAAFIRCGFLGKISSIKLVYKFNQELSEELHDGFWSALEEIFEAPTSTLSLGAMGFDYLEVFINENLIRKITAQALEQSCKDFATKLLPVLKKYGI